MPAWHLAWFEIPTPHDLSVCRSWAAGGIDLLAN
jgi:hypothetical protein